MTRPCLPLRYPYPPPRVRPPMPVWLTVPPTVARPYFAAATSTSSQRQPPSAVMVLASGSTTTFRIFERSITMPFSMDAAPDVECPPPRTAKGMLCSRIMARVVETSSADVTSTTAACVESQHWFVAVSCSHAEVLSGRTKGNNNSLLSVALYTFTDA